MWLVGTCFGERWHRSAMVAALIVTIASFVGPESLFNKLYCLYIQSYFGHFLNKSYPKFGTRNRSPGISANWKWLPQNQHHPGFHLVHRWNHQRFWCQLCRIALDNSPGWSLDPMDQQKGALQCLARRDVKSQEYNFDIAVFPIKCDGLTTIWPNLWLVAKGFETPS